MCEHLCKTLCMLETLLCTLVHATAPPCTLVQGTGACCTPWYTPGARLVHFLVLPQGRVLQAGGGTAPGVPIRVTVGVTGAPAPPLIELQADNSGDIAVPINVPKGATRMELSVSGEGREDMGWGTWGQYGDMGTWGHGMWDV